MSNESNRHGDPRGGAQMSVRTRFRPKTHGKIMQLLRRSSFVILRRHLDNLRAARRARTNAA
eukprot:2353943-Pleurochrysis_carterae.AAC.1